MAAVDRSSALPLWAQILEDLRRRTAANEFAARFPTDAELAATYSVSRQTVREAVRRLQSDGLVVRRRGQGTRLAAPVLEQPLHSIYSLAGSLRAQGLDERSTVLVRDRRRPPDEVARQLRLEAGADAVYLERLRYADGEPIAWDRSWLPRPWADVLLEVDLSAGGLYDAIALHCGLRATGGWERIRPIVPSPRERSRLAVPAGVAAFAAERLALADALPIEWRESLVRGDRCAIVARWPATRLGAGDPVGEAAPGTSAVLAESA